MRPRLSFDGEFLAPEAFQDQCLRAAGALRAAGVGDTDVVAVMMRNHPLALATYLAVRWIGAQWVPVNWHFKTDEVQFILGDSGAKVFVVDSDLLAGLAGLRLDTVQVRVAPRGGVPLRPDQQSWQSSIDGAAPLREPAGAIRGAMHYTSGTTGRPKGIRRGVATPQQELARADMVQRVLGFEPGMRALLNAPMYHSAPNSYAMGAAMADADLVLEERFDAERTLQQIERHRITHAYLVPTMYVRLLRLPEATRRRYDVSSMKFVASTGSPCPPDVKRAMIDWWGPVIHEAYGSSELGYMTLLDSHQALRKPGSAGLPLPGVSLAIRDEQGRALPNGQVGLIYASQPAVADFSYVHNDAARARMELDGHKTMGDMGYLDDEGFLFIVDRMADMVISGGVNIYPAEIEAALLGMPGVADCAVFGIPDAEFGESLLAVVQAVDGAAIDADAVRGFLRARLADYKVPRQVTFHTQLPREDTGKVFKRKLREPYWTGQQRRV